MTPTRLHHAHGRIRKLGNRATEKIWRGNEVRVEDRDDLAAGDLQTRLKGSGLESSAIVPMEVADVDPLGDVPADRRLRDLPRFVDRVIQHLNLEQLAWVVELAYRIDQPIHNVHLIEDRKLDGDRRLGVGCS